jgi:hypothetical protein
MILIKYYYNNGRPSTKFSQREGEGVNFLLHIYYQIFENRGFVLFERFYFQEKLP